MRFAATGMALAQQGCKHIAVIVTAAAGTEKINAAQIEAGIRAGGAKVAGSFTIPATAVDLAPTVAAAALGRRGLHRLRGQPRARAGR